MSEENAAALLAAGEALVAERFRTRGNPFWRRCLARLRWIFTPSAAERDVAAAVYECAQEEMREWDAQWGRQWGV